eukprot:TRINITY_DN10284_c0_g2_i1.p1 TRINITY_DN10284_c0_g2~~TRINITY_DN10284_c0_g2_i1.p1  ORF type:complete len:1514 (+),score=347.22 TRINITY_DN10284_c0_g2_i1:183-4724(+)
MPEKENLTFVIQNKLFTYQGQTEHRERDFFQLFIKALKGTPSNNVTSGIKSFRENLPESVLTDEDLAALYQKHEKRRVDRDNKRKAGKRLKIEKEVEKPVEEIEPEKGASCKPDTDDKEQEEQKEEETKQQEQDETPPPPPDPPQPQQPECETLTPPAPVLAPQDLSLTPNSPECLKKDSSTDNPTTPVTPLVPPTKPEEPLPDTPASAPRSGSEGGQDNVLIDEADQPIDDPVEVEGSECREAPMTALSTTISFDGQTAVSGNPQKSSESNAGWAALPTKKEHTAWERELIRRKDRAEKEKAERSKVDAPSSPLAPPPPPPQRSSSPPLPQGEHHQTRRLRSSRGSGGDPRTKSKERRNRNTDSIQKLMNELLEKTNEIQGRVTQLETASSPRVGSSEGTSVTASHSLPGLPGGMIQRESEILSLVKPNEKGRTVLHEAAEKGAADTVGRLLALGSDVDAKDREGRTPFLVAASLGHLSIVHLLSSKGANIDAEDNTGLGAAALACQGKHSTTVEYLHLRGCAMECVDRYGRTPLHHAIHSSVAALKVLLSITGLDLDVRDKIKSQTAMHYAAMRGFTEAVQELLAAGAMLVVDYDGNGPLALSIQAGHTEITETLIAHSSTGREWSPFHECVLTEGNLQAYLLSKKEVDLNENDARGQTPLMLATLTGNVATIEFLLSKDVDPLHKDDLGRTALHLAAARGQVILCKALVKGGAYVDTEDAFRLTPLHSAILHGHQETALYLASQGADHMLYYTVARLVEATRRQGTSNSLLVVNALKSDITGKTITETSDIHGRTLLHAACFVGDEEGVKYLLLQKDHHQCVPFATDNRGWTALHWVACRDQLYDEKNLENDVSVTALTPLMVPHIKMAYSIAKAASQYAIVKALLLDVGEPDAARLLMMRAKDGRRAVDVAKDEGCDPTIICLLTPKTSFPQMLYVAKKWTIVALGGMIWGVVALGPTALYYVILKRQIFSILPSPYLTLHKGLASVAAKVKQEEYMNQLEYTSMWRTSRMMGLALGVVLLFVASASLPSYVVSAHGDSTVTEAQNDSSIESTMSPFNESDEGKTERNVVLAVMGLVMCVVQLLTAARVLVDQRNGRLPCRVVSKAIDLEKKGNWAMIAFAVIDPLMLSAVPFAIARDNTPLPFLMRTLLMDTLNPFVAVIICYTIVLAWMQCAGVACLYAAVSFNSYLSRKAGVLQADWLSKLPPYAIHFATHTMYLPVLLSVLKLYMCDYSERATVVGTDEECYTGISKNLVVVSFFFLLMYIISSGTVGIVLGQPKGGQADLFWGSPLLCAEKAAYTLCAVLTSLWYDYSDFCFVMYFFVVAMLLVYVGKLDDKNPTMPYVIQWRLLGYSFSIVSLASSAFLFNQGSEAAGAVVFLVCFALVMCLGVVLYKWNQSRFVTAERAQAFRKLHALSRDSNVPPTPIHPNPARSRLAFSSTNAPEETGAEVVLGREASHIVEIEPDARPTEGEKDSNGEDGGGKDGEADGWVLVNETAPSTSNPAPVGDV